MDNADIYDYVKLPALEEVRKEWDVDRKVKGEKHELDVMVEKRS